MLQNYLNELKRILIELNPYKAILFGSYAYGKPDDDSDIDLIVVLNNDNIPKDFDERIQNYTIVKNYLRALNCKIAMDIIVYTKSEWNIFVKAENSFTKEVLERGKVLI
jgi:uncharacterized protein